MKKKRRWLATINIVTELGLEYKGKHVTLEVFLMFLECNRFYNNDTVYKFCKDSAKESFFDVYSILTGCWYPLEFFLDMFELDHSKKAEVKENVNIIFESLLECPDENYALYYYTYGLLGLLDRALEENKVDKKK